MKYVPNPVAVDAIRCPLTSSNSIDWKPVLDWIQPAPWQACSPGILVPVDRHEDAPVFGNVNPGDWLVSNGNGTFRVLSDFECRKLFIPQLSLLSKPTEVQGDVNFLQNVGSVLHQMIGEDNGYVLIVFNNPLMREGTASFVSNTSHESSLTAIRMISQAVRSEFVGLSSFPPQRSN